MHHILLLEYYAGRASFPGLDEPHRGHRKIGSMTAQLPEKVSDIFNPADWRVVEGFEDFTDITYHRQVERDENGEILRDLPTVRIAFDRPRCATHSARTPWTSSTAPSTTPA